MIAMRRKRTPGEGHVRQLPNGRWAVVLSGGWKDGKRVRRWIYGDTQAQALEKMEQAKAEFRAGNPVGVQKEKVAEFLRRWLEDSARPRIKPRSYERFDELIRLHIAPALGSIRLEKLSAADVQRMINAKRREGYSAQTVTHCRNVLRAALNHAMRWGLVNRNVAALVDVPRIERPAVHAVTSEQARILLDASQGSPFEAVYAVALASGARRGELLALTWADVDLDPGRLSITRSLQRIGGKLQLTEVKTAKSRRTIPLAQYAIRALRAHRARQAQQRLAAGAQWRDTLGLVFTNRDGGFVEPVTLNRDFGRIVRKAKLPTMRFHGLRHGAATLMLREGTPLKLIQELLGHSSIAVTSGFYLHLDDEFKRQGADAMDRALGEHPANIKPV
jgi:integrase